MRVVQRLEDILVTLKWRERMQPAGGGSLVRRKGSGLEETQLCVLSPRCMERHLPADCLLFRELPTHHRVSLLAAAGICKKCLSHSRRGGGEAEQCEGQHVEDHWLCQFFSNPEGPEIERKLLPAVISQPGRLTYKCRTVIHVKSRSDLQTGRYSVRLTTLYDSNQRHSFIMNEVASAHALKYIQVPEKRVDISQTTSARTTKLFILDVKPRSTMATAGARLVTAYGVDEMGMTLQEEPSLDGLRGKFATRPGRLSNTNVAQPKAVAQLVIGRDNQAHMPVVALRSVKDGSDLYIMRNDLFVGEMLFGETDKSGQKKKGAAGGSKTTSTPKPKQLKARDPPTASKRPEKAAPVQTPSTASKRPEAAAEERPAAGTSGVKSRRRQDSSPAMSVAASDSMRHAGERQRPEEEHFKRAGPDLREEKQSWRGKPRQRGPRGQPRKCGAGQQRQRDPRGQLRKCGAGQQRQQDPRGQPDNSGAGQQRQQF
jgi:hypothetical protein